MADRVTFDVLLSNCLSPARSILAGLSEVIRYWKSKAAIFLISFLRFVVGVFLFFCLSSSSLLSGEFFRQGFDVKAFSTVVNLR